MIKFANRIFPIALLILIGSCNVYQDVQIIKDKNVDFEQYETYAWLPEKETSADSDYDNDFIRQKTRNYFGHCMEQRQLKPDTVNPELLLQIEWLSHAREVEMPSIQDWPTYYDAEYYNAPTIYIYDDKVTGRPFVGKEYIKNEVVQYAHGGAKLTVVERETNKTIWQGVAQGDLYDPNVMYDDLHPAIHKIMKKFPIKIPKK